MRSIALGSNANSYARAPILTTEETYENNVTAQGLPVDTEEVDDFKLCWIGSRDAKQVIVHICGGALLMHAYDAHIITLIHGYKVMKDNGQDVAIAILVYGLCPGAPYPTQLRQTVATVQHLLKSRAPETVNFSGDSAGGMLINAMLLHHSHPHPKVAPYTLPAGSRFGKALLISAGAPVLTQTASMHQDPNPDMVNPELVKTLWAVITSTSEEGIEMPNPWIGNSSAPEEWWKGLPVGEIKIVVGGSEALRDDIAIWSEFLKVSSRNPWRRFRGFTDAGNIETSRQASGSHCVSGGDSHASDPRCRHGDNGRQSGLCKVLEEVVPRLQSLIRFHSSR